MGQFLKRTEVWRICREILALRIPVYGANACFFLVLAVFPALLLLLGLLQWTALTPEGLTALLRDFLPALRTRPPAPVSAPESGAVWNIFRRRAG